MEDNVLRTELAQAAVARCQRKAPLGSHRESESLPNGALEHREEHEGLPWSEDLLSLVPSEEVVEEEAESEELEEPSVPMPKFEGKRSMGHANGVCPHVWGLGPPPGCSPHRFRSSQP